MREHCADGVGHGRHEVGDALMIERGLYQAALMLPILALTDQESIADEGFHLVVTDAFAIVSTVILQDAPDTIARFATAVVRLWQVRRGLLCLVFT